MIECPKCEHEHEPCGSHEDDSGETECQSCGFKFIVLVEYEPIYSTSCVEHEFGEFKKVACRGELVDSRFCQHCGMCQLK